MNKYMEHRLKYTKHQVFMKYTLEYIKHEVCLSIAGTHENGVDMLENTPIMKDTSGSYPQSSHVEYTSHKRI